VSTSFREPLDFLSAALKLSTEKVKVLDEVSQGGRTIAGPSWTVTETVKVIPVVYTSYRESEPGRVYLLPY
jgi:hypothetical protein